MIHIIKAMVSKRSPLDPPSENTLTINLVHEILENINRHYFEAVAFSPSRGEEGDLGYDVTFNWAKLFVLQIKHYSRQLTGKIRYDGSLSKAEYLKYRVDEDQHKTLCKKFPARGLAFFAIPLATKRSQLSGILPRTLFIDVHDLPRGATMISIPRNHRFVFNPSKNRCILEINGPICYCVNGSHQTFNLFTEWGSLFQQLVSCVQGILVRRNGSETRTLDELRSEWQPQDRDGTKLKNTSKIFFGGSSLPENVDWRGDFRWEERTRNIKI